VFTKVYLQRDLPRLGLRFGSGEVKFLFCFAKCAARNDIAFAQSIRALATTRYSLLIA
jgi:hypothetical protein